MIGMYREPSPKLISAPWKGVVMDRGVLRKAIKNSKGEYLFSEAGVGVQPLVAIGTLPQLIAFFYTNRNVIISNEISDLPEIYVGVSKFVEKKRYDGTYPLHDAINAVTKSMLDFVPADTIIDALSNATTFGTILKDLFTDKKKTKYTTDLLYLKISYLNDIGDNGKKIGTGKTSLEVILRYLLGIKETSV